MNVKSFLYTLALIVFINYSFGQSKFSRQEYIEKYSEMAVHEMKRSGVPASITLAQGMLESDNGNSTLATKANNHFGIKCHSDWQGGTYYHDDDRPNECFRKYKSAEGSFIDHSDFLLSHQRYAFLFDFETTDYKSWAKGLKKAGYATNNQYAEMLIKIIEDNELYRFDDGSFKKIAKAQKNRRNTVNNTEEETINPFGNDIQSINRIDYIVAKEGDTFEKIAERYELMPWQILKYNELTRDSVITQGTRLYLQPKRRKADIEHKYHTFKSDDSMYKISQLYGIKLKHLYRLNHLEPGTQPEQGTQLFLRKKAKRSDK